MKRRTFGWHVRRAVVVVLVVPAAVCVFTAAGLLELACAVSDGGES